MVVCHNDHYEMCPMRPMRQTVESLRVMVLFLRSTAAVLSGYDVMKQTGLPKPTAYEVVQRLAKDGSLNGYMERTNLRMGMAPRMLYEVTPQGAAKARAILDLLKVST